MAGKVTMSEVTCGLVSLDHLLKINALLDAQAAEEDRARRRAQAERP